MWWIWRKEKANDVDSPTITIGSFCTGAGWLDLAVKLACEHVGIRTVPAFACEWDAYAAEVLRSRMEDSSLESCPIWCGDLRKFPSEQFRGVVDAAAFGFPCQDISYAGQGAGIRGKRSGMFFDILEKCCDMGCRILFMENVAAITNRGLDTVLGTLADNGFDAEWCCLTASAVGASHKRNRWFCVAYRSESRSRRVPESNGRNDAADVDRSIDELANTVVCSHRTKEHGDETIRKNTARSANRTGGCSESVADTTRTARRERPGRERVLDSGQEVEHATCERTQVADVITTSDGKGIQQFDGRDSAMADTEQSGLGRQRLSRTGQDGRSEVIGTGEALEHASSERRQTRDNSIQPSGDQSTARKADDSGEGCGLLGDTQRDGQRTSGQETTEIANEGLPPIFAPGPSDFDGWGRVVADGSFDFRAPSIKPGVRVLVDGKLLVVDQSRADQLRCAGNGVVVLQAAAAFVGLMRRACGGLGGT